MSKLEEIKKATHYLGVDYDEFDADTYRGVVIYESDKLSEKEMIRIFTDCCTYDEELALQILDTMTDGEYTCEYLSSYDNYLLDIQYRDDPYFREEVDNEYKNADFDMTPVGDKYIETANKEPNNEGEDK